LIVTKSRENNVIFQESSQYFTFKLFLFQKLLLLCIHVDKRSRKRGDYKQTPLHTSPHDQGPFLGILISF